MKRSNFIKSVLGLLTVPFIVKAKPEFNVDGLKEKIDEIHKYPLTKKECFIVQRADRVVPYDITIDEDKLYVLHVDRFMQMDHDVRPGNIMVDNYTTVYRVQKVNRFGGFKSTIHISLLSKNRKYFAPSRRRKGKKPDTIGNAFYSIQQSFSEA